MPTPNIAAWEARLPGEFAEKLAILQAIPPDLSTWNANAYTNHDGLASALRVRPRFAGNPTALAAYGQAERLLAAEAPSAQHARVLADHAHALLDSDRPQDAIPRWRMFVTHPKAIIGQLSMTRYALKATNSPSVIRPRMTSRLPSHRISSEPMPRKNVMLG